MQTVRLMPVAALALALAACGTEPAPQPQPADTATPAPAAPDQPTGALAGTALTPAAFIGVWDYEQGTCDPECDMRLDIAQERFEFYESVGEVRAVRIEGEATVVDLAMEGEGEMWDQSLRMVLKDKGERLHVTEPGNASDTDDYPRKRCPA